MELPQIQSGRINVKIIQGVKDVSTGRSISKLEKSEKFTEMYRLRGNNSLDSVQRYKELMDRYLKSFTHQKILIKAKKEVKDRHLIKQFSSFCPMRGGQLSNYRISYSPQRYFKL